jgi:predicted RNase H-like HicB family nuclease
MNSISPVASDGETRRRVDAKGLRNFLEGGWMYREQSPKRQLVFVRVEKILSKKSNFDVFSALRGRRRRSSGRNPRHAKAALSYPIELSRHEEGGFQVRSPHFPEVETFGFDEDDALMHARFALEEAIAARIANRQVVPVPLRIGTEHVPIALPDNFAKILERYWRFNLGQFARRSAD